MSNLAALDSNVRRWLKGVRPAAIAVLLEAIQDELESRGHALGTLGRARTGEAGSESPQKVGRQLGPGAGALLPSRLAGRRPSLADRRELDRVGRRAPDRLGISTRVIGLVTDRTAAPPDDV